MGLKKTRELISVFPALFSACIDRLDVVPANPSQYQYHLPGGIAFFFFDQQKGLESTTSTAGIIESTESCHSTRTTCPAAASY